MAGKEYKYHFLNQEGEVIRDYFYIINKRLNRMMGILTPIGVCIGLLLGEKVSCYKPVVTYLFAFVTFSGALGMKASDFTYLRRKPAPVALAIACSHIIMPLVVYCLGSIMFQDRKDTVTGFILLYSNPTAVVSYIWCSIYMGNEILSLSLILLSTILAPVITPLAVKILTATDVQIDTTGMMISLLYMVVIPSICGVLINTITKGKAESDVNPYLKPFTKVALILVSIINTSQVSGQLSIGLSLFEILIVNVGLAFFGFYLGYFMARMFRLSEQDVVSLSYSVGLRNISAALVLAVSFFPPDSSIPVLIGITIQQVIASFFGTAMFGRKK